MGNSNILEERRDKREGWALAISIVALILSLIVFIYTIYQDMIGNREIIELIRGESGYRKCVSFKAGSAINNYGVLSGTYYSVIISNNSKKRISIVSGKLSGKYGTEKYDNVFYKMRDGSDQPIAFPINLASGESIKIKLEIDTEILNDTKEIIIERYGKRAEIEYEELEKYLASEGVDIFGNEVNYTMYWSGEYIITARFPEYPVYDLKFVSSQNNVYEISLSKGNIE